MQRALTALSLSHPHKLDAAMDLIWQNFWATYNEPEKPENLRALLTTVLGSEVEAQDVMERAKSEQVKKLLTERTMRAFDEGAFGLPWFVGTSLRLSPSFCPLSFSYLSRFLRGLVLFFSLEGKRYIYICVCVRK